MIRIEEISLGIHDDQELLLSKIYNILKVKKIVNWNISKRAIDSRKKKNILFVFSIDVEVEDEEKVLDSISIKDVKKHRIRLIETFIYNIKAVKEDKERKRPIIVGMGPSGIFCAIVLAEAGLKPLVIERGKDVDSRIKDVELFFKKRELNIKSNVEFGEGGAGTFSDGKLYTNIRDNRTKYIFKEFIFAGADPEIAYDARPHIGTDKLRTIVKNLRRKIIELQGDVRFNSCLTDINFKNNKIESIVVNGKEKILTNDLILAIGHSARDTYEMLYNKNIKIQQKPFSIGVRIEHKREMIDRSQYGEEYNNPRVPRARYDLVVHLKDRSVYTFCMCPGGYVISGASEENMITTNGMSESRQDGENSNSALLVNIYPSDFESDHPLAGIEFQRKWERRAFEVGGKNYDAPIQLVGDFLKDKSSFEPKDIQPTYMPGVNLTSLKDCLPNYVVDSLKEALPLFDNKIRGFANEGAILTGIETRSSSPLRILRNENFETNVLGIYPIGEGAGYAGGITSSAIDGMILAEKIIDKYA
ncbi:MAG: hypothetical protein PHY30_00715 [Candidatus Pacebacteria bacterium]|nr:hypothetical protein [Candidatus Paceibacterota bacterium]